MGLFLTQYANEGKSCGSDVYSYKRNPFTDTVETSEESESIPALVSTTPSYTPPFISEVGSMMERA